MNVVKGARNRVWKAIQKARGHTEHQSQVRDNNKQDENDREVADCELQNRERVVEWLGKSRFPQYRAESTKTSCFVEHKECLQIKGKQIGRQRPQANAEMFADRALYHPDFADWGSLARTESINTGNNDFPNW